MLSRRRQLTMMLRASKIHGEVQVSEKGGSMILVRMFLPIALVACATPVVQLADAPTLDQSERAVLGHLSRVSVTRRPH